MSEQMSNDLKSGANTAKSGAKVAGKAGKTAIKKGGKAVVKSASHNPYILAVVLIISFLILISVIGGTSGTQMAPVYSLTPLLEEEANRPETEEAKTRSIEDKTVATDQTADLLSVISDKKTEERDSHIAIIKRQAKDMGVDPEATIQHMTEETLGGSNGVQASSITASENSLKMWKFFKANGYSDAACAGILGNINRESGFNTGAVNYLGCIGMVQWYQGRASRLKAMAASKGKSWKDIDVQLDMMLYEFQHSYTRFSKSEFKKTNSVKYATEQICQYYEIPGNYGIEFPVRTSYAKKFYELYKGVGGDASAEDDAKDPEGYLESRGDYEVLAAYSISVANAYAIKVGDSNLSASSDGELDDKTYVDINGNPLKMYFFGKRKGQINYKGDLKKKIGSRELGFYQVTYNKNEDGTMAISEDDGKKYLPVTLTERDTASMAQDMFDLKGDDKYVNANNVTNDVAIKHIALETYALIGDGDDLCDGGMIAKGKFVKPLGNARYTITSPYGGRYHPIGGYSSFHTGIDLAAPQGTSVCSVKQGTVVRASWFGGYGNCIDVDHGGGIITRYGHLSRIGVRVGAKVKAGQKIGEVGSTGNSTGPHLHFEVRLNNSHTDPAKFMAKHGAKL